MITGISSSDAYVYHYTKPSTARDFILQNGTLRLGPYSKTNDPKETKAWEFGLSTVTNRDFEPYNHLSPWLSHELKARTRLACFSMDRDPLTGQHMTDIYHRGFTKPRMWSQYADGHTGVCLVFLRKNLLAIAKQELGSRWLMAGPITYQDHFVARGAEAYEFMLNIDAYDSLGPKEYVRAHVRAHHKALFFEKLVDWRDEHEWRLLAFCESDEELFLPIKQCLVGVMHGDATDPDLSEELMRLTLGWGAVEHMGLSWKNSTPWYDYGSFSWIPGKVTNPRRSKKGA